MKPWSLVVTLVVGLFATVLLLPVAGHSDTNADGTEQDQWPDSDFTLKAARVFTGAELLEPGWVEVRDGRISRIGASLEPDSDLPLVDLGDRTLMPGLIDAHVHAFGTALTDALNFGVTTVLDQTNDDEWANQLRQSDEGARFFSSGPPATAPGGHGTQYGFTPPQVHGPEDADEFAQTILDGGSDWMKIIIERGMGNWQVPSLDHETVKALVDAAEKAGLMPVAHVSELETAHWAMEAGARGLVHVFADRPVDDDLLKIMADGNRFLIPTLVVMEGVAGTVAVDPDGDERITPWLSGSQRSSLTQRWPGPRNETLRQRVIENTRAMHAAGIDILAGSDAPNPGTAHGLSLHREMELLVEAGLSTHEALAAATLLPARHFGLADRGLLESGRRADLLVIDGDPLDDISATLSIHAIWQDGRPVQRVRTRIEAAAGVLEHGRMSEFRADHSGAGFGQGWEPTDDTMAGGASTVEMQPVGDEELAWIRLSGEIRSGFGWPWAGAMFFPGDQPMAPVDLSAFENLRFKVRGEPAGLRVMVFSPALGTMPATQTIEIGADWQVYELALKGFSGADLAAISGVAFVAGPELGPFEFDLAEVILE
jgi:imidazolonepropionase-like amidohydrolase